MSNPFLELQTRLGEMTRRGVVQTVLSGDAPPLAWVENEWREDGATVSRAALDSMLLAFAPDEIKARLRLASDDSLEWTHTDGGKFFHFVVVSQNGARTATITAVDERGNTLGFEGKAQPESAPQKSAKTEDDGTFWESIAELEADVLAKAPLAPESPPAKPTQTASQPAEKRPNAADANLAEFEVGAMGLPPRRWHFEHAGKKHGPVSTGKIIELIQNKIVLRNSMVHHDEMADWQQVKLTELDTIFERRRDLDPAMEAERLEAIDVRSSGNPYAALPGELIGINVGGLFVGPLWAMAMGVWGWGLLSLLTPILLLRIRALVPASGSDYDVTNPIRNILFLAAIGVYGGFGLYYALLGNELAWTNREWRSFAHFRKHQRLWAIVGTLAAASLFFAVVARARRPVVTVRRPVPVAEIAPTPPALPAPTAQIPAKATTKAPSQNPVATSAPDPAFEAGDEAEAEGAPKNDALADELSE